MFRNGMTVLTTLKWKAFKKRSCNIFKQYTVPSLKFFKIFARAKPIGDQRNSATYQGGLSDFIVHRSLVTETPEGCG